MENYKVFKDLRSYFIKQLVVAYEIPLPIDDFGSNESNELLKNLEDSLKYRIKIQDQAIDTIELDSNYLFRFRIIFECKIGYLTLNEYEDYFTDLRSKLEEKLEEFFKSKDVYYMKVLCK